MASEESQPLAYVPEIVLKKRKRNEEWALRRRERLGARKKSKKESLKNVIKKPEQFIKEYRDKELDFVRMKNRVKLRKSSLADPGSKLLFVIRIHGSKDMHPQTRKVLHLLRLRQIFDGVFLKCNEAALKMLLRVEPFVTYGYPNLKNVRDLVYKKGNGKVEKQRVPLTDNNLIEQALGSCGIICIEDLVHEIATVGPHFKEVTRFLYPFKLKKPGDGVLQKKKRPYKEGGDTGNREDKINDLINKMN